MGRREGVVAGPGGVESRGAGCPRSPRPVRRASNCARSDCRASVEIGGHWNAAPVLVVWDRRAPAAGDPQGGNSVDSRLRWVPAGNSGKL